jgi:lipopolysaccharide transport system permease protein
MESPPAWRIRGEVRPLVVIERGSNPVLSYLRDSWHHRDLVRVLTIRDLKLRYRQTALGVAWVVLQPVLAAGILSFVFGKVAKLPTDGVPYFVFAFAGMLGYNLFSNTLSRAATCFISNSSLVSKIFFPRIILPLSLAGSALVDFAVGLAMMIGIMFLSSTSAGIGPLLCVPLFVVLFLLLAEGIGSLLGSLAVRYRDVPQIVPVVLQFAVFASPVAYAASAIPKRYQGVFFLNPLAGLLDGLRWALLGTPAPSAGHLAYAVVASVLVFAVGMFATRRMERWFADVI